MYRKLYNQIQSSALAKRLQLRFLRRAAIIYLPFFKSYMVGQWIAKNKITLFPKHQEDDKEMQNL